MTGDGTEAGGTTWGDDLSQVQRDPEAYRSLEDAARRSVTPQESLQHLAALYRAFATDLRDTEALFAADHWAYLEELQRRLGKLADVGGAPPAGKA